MGAEDLRKKREAMFQTGVYPFDWVQLTESIPPSRRSKGGFALHWGVNDFGSGEILFFTDLDGKLRCESETMPRGFVEQALLFLARSADMGD